MSFIRSRSLGNEDDKITSLESELHADAKEASALYWSPYTAEESENNLSAQTT